MEPNESKYKKPKMLVKKIYENARKMSNIRRKIKEEEIKKQQEEITKDDDKNSKQNRFKKKLK
jgi:hypothetical protein